MSIRFGIFRGDRGDRIARLECEHADTELTVIEPDDPTVHLTENFILEMAAERHKETCDCGQYLVDAYKAKLQAQRQ